MAAEKPGAVALMELAVKKLTNITVAVATLGRPEALKRCLDAILEGQVLPAELVIVDQGRTDEIQRLLAGLQIAPVSLVYVPQDRRGLSASRNAAAEASGCPAIAFTDDDCVPSPGWLAAIDRAFAADIDVSAVTGRLLPLGPEKPGTYVVSSRESAIRINFHQKTLPWFVGSGANFSIKYEALRSAGGFDERLGVGSPGKASEDMDLIYKLLRSGRKILYEPEAVIYHERQDKAYRLASRWNYGFGIGAFCTIWMLRGDLYSVYMLANWFYTRARELAGSILGRRWFETHQWWLSIAGTLRGIFYGLSLSLRKTK